MRGPTLKFILVDDDEDYHKTMTREVQLASKVSLKCVANGDDAIDKLKDQPNLYDAIILDFNCINKRGEKPNKRFLNDFKRNLKGLRNIFWSIL